LRKSFEKEKEVIDFYYLRVNPRNMSRNREKVVESYYLKLNP